MKVLKSGRPENWTTTVECRRCKSELEVELADLRRQDPDVRDHKDFIVFDCSVCAQLIYLDAALVPDVVLWVKR